MADGETSVEMEKEEKAMHETDRMGAEGSDSEEEEEDIYEVEQIVDMTKSKGKTLYRVRWAGYGPNWDTWEPISNLDSCKDMVNRFTASWHEHQRQQEEEEEEEEEEEDSKKVAASRNLPAREKTKEAMSDISDDGESVGSGGQRRKSKKNNYFYVDQEDDQADTLKDKFWRDLEQGKINVFGNDMYSKVKGQGRSSRPASFTEMFKNSPCQGTSDEDHKKKRRRQLKRENSSSSLGSSTKSRRAKRKKSRSSSMSSSVSGRRVSEDTLSQYSDTGADTQPTSAKSCRNDKNGSDKKGSRGKLKGRIKSQSEDNWVAASTVDGSTWQVSQGSSSSSSSGSGSDSQPGDIGQPKVPVVVVRRVSDGLSVSNIKEESAEYRDTAGRTTTQAKDSPPRSAAPYSDTKRRTEWEPETSGRTSSRTYLGAAGSGDYGAFACQFVPSTPTFKEESLADPSHGTWTTSPIPVMDTRRRYTARESEKSSVNPGSRYSTHYKQSQFTPVPAASCRQPGTVEEIRQTWMKKDPKILSCSVLVRDVQKTQGSGHNYPQEDIQKQPLKEETLDEDVRVCKASDRLATGASSGDNTEENSCNIDKSIGKDRKAGGSTPPRPIPVHISVSPNTNPRVVKEHPDFEPTASAQTPAEPRTTMEGSCPEPMSKPQHMSLPHPIPILAPVTKPAPSNPPPQTAIYTPTPVYTPTPIAKLATANPSTAHIVGVSIPDPQSQLGERAVAKQSPNKPSDAYIPGQISGLPAVNDQLSMLPEQSKSTSAGTWEEPDLKPTTDHLQTKSGTQGESFGNTGPLVELRNQFADIRNCSYSREKGLDWDRENSVRAREGSFQPSHDTLYSDPNGGRFQGGIKVRGQSRDLQEHRGLAVLQSRGNDPPQGSVGQGLVPQSSKTPLANSGPPALTRVDSYGPPTPTELPVFGDDSFNPFKDVDMRCSGSNNPGHPVASRASNPSQGGNVSQRLLPGYPYSPYQATSTGSPAWSVSTPSPGTPGSCSGTSQALGTPGGSSSKPVGDETAFDFDLTEIDPAIWEQKQEERKPDSLEISNAELKNAVRNNDYERVRRAMQRRKRYDLEMRDEAGVTLLMVAAAGGYDDVLELLVLNGANINARSKNGITALMLACENGHRCTVELLLIMGANMNVQQAGGETALVMAVRCGNKQIVRLLLDHGANFTSPSYTTDITPIKVAKQRNYTEILEALNAHISCVTADFENQVLITLNNTAEIQCALFPMQCFALGESDHFTITFNHELQPTRPGVGMLLFIAHARITSTEVRCRFYGPCAVLSSVLNGYQLSPLTEEANFVMSFSPLYNGRNELEIKTVKAPTSRAKLVVCAYKAKLALPPD